VASLLSTEDSEPFSGTWPTSGSMRNGRCYQRARSVPRIAENGSGYWPTATGADSRSSGGNPATTGTHHTTQPDWAVRRWATPVARDDQKSPEAHLVMKARMKGGPRSTVTSLTVQAKMWQTPSAADAAGGHERRGGKRSDELLLKGQAKVWPTPRTTDRFGADTLDESGRTTRGTGPDLPSIAKTWPTPQARDHKDEYTGRRNGGRDLPGQARTFHSSPQDQTTTTDGATSSNGTQVLNPRFVEMLLGWPIGWTDCTRSATASYHSWLRTHSSALHAALASSTEVA